MMFDINSAIAWTFVFVVWLMGLSTLGYAMKSKTLEGFCRTIVIGLVLTIGMVLLFEQGYRITQ
jgi:hypothetical protein